METKKLIYFLLVWKHNRMSSVKKNEKKRKFVFFLSLQKLSQNAHLYQHQILPNTSTVPANFWLEWVTVQ
jgi:hypothetical protein